MAARPDGLAEGRTGQVRPLIAATGLSRGERFPALLKAHESSDSAKAVIAAEGREIDLCERYRLHMGYGYYIAQKDLDES